MAEDEIIEWNTGDDEFDEVPACFTCEYFFDGGTCKAFPNGIPDEFLSGENRHNSAYPGDKGIRYTPMKRD